MPFKENTPDHELKRQTRGLAIASIYSSIRRINKLRYKVKSQSDEWKRYVSDVGLVLHQKTNSNYR